MSRLPPGPTSIGLFDHLRAALSSPVPLLKRCAARYGDPFRIPTNTRPLTFTGDPEAIRAIYTADPDTFDVWGTKAVEPVFGTTSLVVSAGERHKRDRKLLTPPFHGSAMRAHGATIAQIAARAAAQWTPGRPFSMLEATQSIALDIIVRVVFGVEGDARTQRTREAVLRLIDSFHPVIFIFPAVRRELGGFGPWAQNRRRTAALDALLGEEIDARRGAIDARQDILSMMLRARYDDGAAMSTAELTDQLRTLLFAGHETTAVALAWAFYWLHREPEALARLRDELDALGPEPAPEALASLPYLEAVCQETLRMHPPVVDVARVPRRPFDLVGYTIPAGEGVCPSPLLLHMREDLYPEPERFRPSRFLDRKLSPFDYIPFGGGARRCLGAAFAMYEMKVVLGTVLRAHRLRLARPASHAPVQHVRRGITLGPNRGIEMVLEGSQSSQSSQSSERANRNDRPARRVDKECGRAHPA